MKLSTRLLSVLLVCLSLFVPFSAIAHADSVPQLYYSPAIISTNWDYISKVDDVLRPLDSIMRWKTDSESPNTDYIFYPQFLAFEYTGNENGFNLGSSTILCKARNSFTISLDNYNDYIVYFDSSGNEIGTRERVSFNPSLVTVQIFTADGTPITLVDTYDISYGLTSNHRIKFTLTVKNVLTDVYRIRILFKEDTFPFGGSRPSSYSTWQRRFEFDKYSTHSFSTTSYVEDEVDNIADGIDDINTNLNNGFSSVVDKLDSGFTSLLDGLLSIPSKIWGFIENGLKSLFVPDEDFMTDYSNKWDVLLSQRFGALYEVGAVIADFGESLLDTLSSDSRTYIIEFPEVTVPLPDRNSFTFGGWEVNLEIPYFSVVYDAIYMITAALGTFVFINGLRKRYDNIMGVND